MRGFVQQRGVSTIEYAVLIMIVISILMVMQFYISRSFNGHWKATGDSFAFGRQYQHGKTVDCAYSQINATFGVWYDDTCYRQALVDCKPGDIPCEDQKKIRCAQDTQAFCQQN